MPVFLFGISRRITSDSVITEEDLIELVEAPTEAEIDQRLQEVADDDGMPPSPFDC